MKFSYTALNNEYKKVAGVITADDEKKAKAELHQMGLSVLFIAEDTGETVEVPASSNVRNFWFLVRDENGHTSSGTIESLDEKNAFRRLVSEYKLEVLGLCSADVPEADRKKTGKQNLKDLEAMVKQEFNVEPLHYSAVQEEEVSEEFLAGNKNFEIQKKQILEEVAAVITKAEEMMSEHKDDITADEFQSIKRNVDTLSRLKLSNNLPYIQQLSEELFDSIHSIIMRYENNRGGQEGISNTPMSGVISKLHQDESNRENAVHERAVAGSFTLNQLQSISRRLGTLLDKHGFPHQQQKSSPEKKEGGLAKLAQGLKLAGLLIIAKDMASRRAVWRELCGLFSSTAELPADAHQAPSTAYVILNELRVFSGWMLGFYITFFFLAEYVFLKGVNALLPAIRNLFATPFLIFFAVFLFLFSFNLSLWDHFFRRKNFLFFCSSVVSLGLFVLFVLNF